MLIATLAIAVSVFLFIPLLLFLLRLSSEHLLRTATSDHATEMNGLLFASVSLIWGIGALAGIAGLVSWVLVRATTKKRYRFVVAILLIVGQLAAVPLFFLGLDPLRFGRDFGTGGQIFRDGVLALVATGLIAIGDVVRGMRRRKGANPPGFHSPFR